MGWTEYAATHYNKHGIDRRAECRDYFKRNDEYYELLKDTLVGSTWYAAIRYKKTGQVFCAVFLTSTRDGYWFAYKDMDDTCGPCNADCPNSILDLLSPTENEFSLEWRARCRMRNEFERKLRKATVIDVVYSFETTHRRAGDKERLWRYKTGGKTAHWYNAPKGSWPEFRVSPRLLRKLNITFIA